ncbi:MAG: 2-oxoacid:acceptor oxidoreductase subunit alpha [Sulfobacillus thermosulfidooxidans]|nr:MAG: 2-oxoacid:acceptor oxidoreductase subunit alpha [Sulfobacillus thermosulfidooxidans]
MIAWKIGGDQGEGIDSTGDIVIHVANRLGYYVYGYKSFSSRIKGGHTHYKVRLGTHPIQAATRHTDILVALNQETIELEGSELQGGVILADSAFSPVLPPGIDAQLLALPMTQMAKELGSGLMRNMIAAGASAALMGLGIQPFYDYVAKRFGTKGAEVVKANQMALQRGYQALSESAHTLKTTWTLTPPIPADRLVMTGNDAVALGALAGGCRLMCGYPITPATDIMESLVKWFPSVGGAVVQMEDELGSITAAIGAGFAGARAMTATSGPGLSLMQEAIGLAAMTETPVVIVDTQRGGPSTGMPTKQEQSDLLAMIYGGHGEAPRIVITPSSLEESFEDGYEAFNLAEIYQTPVFIATDLSLALWQQSIERSHVQNPVPIERGKIVQTFGSNTSEPFQRYAFTADNISPRTLPGTPGGQYLATGVEHAPSGKVSEAPENRARMMDKRLHKIQSIHSRRQGFLVQGPANADLMLIGIGSTAAVNREAAQLLQQSGIAAAVGWFRTIAPFPHELFASATQGSLHILIVEQNATGQIAQLIQMQGLYDQRFATLLKYDGVPFLPEDVAQYAQQLIASSMEVTH